MFRYKLTKQKIYTSLSFCLLLILFAPIVSKADAEKNISPEKDIFYVKLLNYTMPVVKSVTFSEEEIAEYNFSLKGKALEILGLNIQNPLSIIGRELSFLKPLDQVTHTASNDNDNKLSFSLNPFKFNESNIIKNKPQNNNSNNNANTPINVEIPNINAANVYNSKLKKPLNAAKPEVLIYHSHTTESYRPYENNEMDANKNILSVGEVIANDLEKNYGIATIHDKTYHSTQDFLKAYEKSGATVDKYLNKYKDFKLIIDLHRDGLPNNTAKSVFATKMNNTNLARYMIVIGTGNKTKDSNIAVARKLSSISQTFFPGLIRPGVGGTDYGIHYYQSARFNQHKNGHAILIELGAQDNTLDEAKATGLYLSRIIAEYVNGK